MSFRTLGDFLASGRLARCKGPIALIFVEDLVEVESTLRHHIAIGFQDILLFAPSELTLPADLADAVHRIGFNTLQEPVHALINKVIATAPDRWFYYCFNAEYLYFPFCEDRTIQEAVVFQTEERRDSILCYTVDLYAGDLSEYPSAVALGDAYLDKSGYYALARDGEGGPKDRQLDFFGGLRWRFEEHIPQIKRKIDRVSVFRAVKGLELRADHTFNIDEYNTFSCPWHNNMTATVCSFRTAKALKANPGSTFEIETFRWHNSTRFDWSSQQLMDLGLMEPGQWF